MTVAVTAAMAVTVGAGIQQFPQNERDVAISTMAQLVGVFMILFGVLRGGRLLRFVSNALMKGFLNGVAVLVVVGQLSNVTGYDSSGSTKLAKALDTALHPALWEPRLGSRRFFELYAETWRRSILNLGGRKRWSDWSRQVRPSQVPYLTRVLWRTKRMMSPEAYLAEHR